MKEYSYIHPYQKGSKVAMDGRKYEATRDVPPGQSPLFNSIYWKDIASVATKKPEEEENDDFSDAFLGALAIADALNIGSPFGDSDSDSGDSSSFDGGGGDCGGGGASGED